MKTKILVFFLVVFSQSFFSQKIDQKYYPKEYLEITHPEWSKNATIYEVNLRQYTPEGTFKAFEKHLPRLKSMGVDIIWLMPIHPIGEKKQKRRFRKLLFCKRFSWGKSRIWKHAGF